MVLNWVAIGQKFKKIKYLEEISVKNPQKIVIFQKMGLKFDIPNFSKLRLTYFFEGLVMQMEVTREKNLQQKNNV